MITPVHSSFMSLAMPARVRVVVLCGLLISSTGCRQAAIAFGPDVAAARAHGDAFMMALQQRFTRVVRHPKFLNARMRMGRYALSPSKLVNDTALWTSTRTTREGPVRELEVLGGLSNGQYTFQPKVGAPAPVRMGDARHVIGLMAFEKRGDWQWTTLVENAVGTMPPARAADVLRAFFASAERPATTFRSDYRNAFPRTTAAFGRMFSLDSVLTASQADGSTLVAMHILTSEARLQVEFPEFAKFVRKYLGPSRFRVRLTDRGGADWFDIVSEQSRLVMRFRSHNGELQPLVGVARRMPDTLSLHIDGSEKVSFFRVGARDLLQVGPGHLIGRPVQG